MKITPQLLRDKEEQKHIRAELESAMPVNVLYHNIIVVLAEMLQSYSKELAREIRDNETKSNE